MLRLVKAFTGNRWFHPLLLLLWIAVGLGLRLMRLTAKTPWTDEFATIVFSLGHTFATVPLDQSLSINDLLQPIQPDPTTGIGDVIHHLLKNSNHPPLYFVLAHQWMRLFPSEDGLVSMWAARSLPALFGTLSIPAMFGFSLLAFRSRLVGQMAAAMMAVSPFGIFLAQEARHYTLAILFVIASVCCLIIAVQSIHHRTLLPSWVGLTWVVINTLGVATHYFFTFTLGAEALVLLALAWRQGKRRSCAEGNQSFSDSENVVGCDRVQTGRSPEERGEESENFSAQTQDREQTCTPELSPATPTRSKKATLLSTQMRSLPHLGNFAPVTSETSLRSPPRLLSFSLLGQTQTKYRISQVRSGIQRLKPLPVGCSIRHRFMKFCTKTNPQIISRPWWRIYLVAAGTVTGSLVWLPILQSNYDYDLTHWIYDGNPLERWLEPIGRVLAWFITILTSLPMEFTTLPLGILIASGLVTVIFVLWALPILRYGLKPDRFPPDTRLNLRVLGDFIIGALVLFFGITYTLGADLTLAPRYQFVYFPVAIALLGAALATSWDTSIPAAQRESTLAKPHSCVVRFSRRGGKKAVTLIWLMGLLGGLTVTWNLGYLQSIRPDLLVNVIQKVSDSPVLIATTHQHHGHTGRMMGLAWEFKHFDPSHSPESREIASPKFLLAHVESGSQAKDPTITLQETVAGLPRPLDVWLVNFHAGIDLAQQNCFAASQRLPKVDSYWYRLYHCPAPSVS